MSAAALTLPQEQSTTSQQSTLTQQWTHLMHKGTQCHKQGNTDAAARFFTRAVTLAQQSLYHCCSDCTTTLNTDKNGAEMLYFASHNLSACYNDTRRSQEAEAVLTQSHQTIIDVAVNKRLPKTLRVDALATLDSSLFSLASQLGYLNKTADIYALIRTTEQTASAVSRQLFH